jgi:hypothetical protein
VKPSPVNVRCVGATAAGGERVCFLSRRRGWIDPARPERPASEVNLLAVYTGFPVWTLGTAWEAIFRSLMPRDVESAYRKATARSRLSDEELVVLRRVADALGVRLEIVD